MAMTNESWRTDFDYQWTPRQRQVLDLIARGSTNAEIASELQITHAGAKWHVSEVLSKLGVDSREDAAAYWKATNSPVQRIRRMLGAAAGVGALWKAAVGATGLAAIAGSTLIVASLASDTPPLIAATATPRPTHTPPPTPGPFELPVRTSPDYVIATLGEPVPRPVMAAYFTDRGLCLTFRSAASDAMGEISCALFDTARIQPFPPYLMSYGPSCPWTTISGLAPTTIGTIRVVSQSGDSTALTLFPPPPELHIDGRFYFAAFPCDGSLARVEALDANGLLLGSQELYDPLHAPITTSQPPLGAAFHASGIGDPGGSGSTGGQAFAVSASGGPVTFDVEHQGDLLISLGVYCQTGILDVRWVGARTSPGGSGTIVIDVPAGNAACHFYDIRSSGPRWIDGR